MSIFRDWMTNPFAMKELADVLHQYFRRPTQQEGPPSSGRGSENINASVFSKEDEAEFEGLMERLLEYELHGDQTLRDLEPHRRVNCVIALLKDHQSDDLRYTIVKKRLRKYFEKQERTVTEASTKAPKKTEYVWMEVSKEHTTKDERIRYLIYLARIEKLNGAADVVEMLIARRVIKRQSVAEKLAEAKDAALEKLVEYWEGADEAAARSLARELFEQELRSARNNGLPEETALAFALGKAEIEAEKNLRELKKSRQGSVGKGYWIFAGIALGLSIIGIVALAAMSSGL